MNSTEQFRNTQDSPLWTTSDLSRFLGCSERQVYNLRKQGLPTRQVGGMVRFEQSKVRAWLAAQDSAATLGDDRARQLADISATGDDDNAECAAADLAREFPAPLS
jgi:predicted DNA-binding transcriptional regulator AlpA